MASAVAGGLYAGQRRAFETRRHQQRSADNQQHHDRVSGINFFSRIIRYTSIDERYDNGDEHHVPHVSARYPKQRHEHSAPAIPSPIDLRQRKLAAEQQRQNNHQREEAQDRKRISDELR